MIELELDYACLSFQRALNKASNETIAMVELKLDQNYEHPAWKEIWSRPKRTA